MLGSRDCLGGYTRGQGHWRVFLCTSVTYESMDIRPAVPVAYENLRCITVQRRMVSTGEWPTLLGCGLALALRRILVTKE